MSHAIYLVLRGGGDVACYLCLHSLPLPGPASLERERGFAKDFLREPWPQWGSVFSAAKQACGQGVPVPYSFKHLRSVILTCLGVERPQFPMKTGLPRVPQTLKSTGFLPIVGLSRLSSGRVGAQVTVRLPLGTGQSTLGSPPWTCEHRAATPTGCFPRCPRCVSPQERPK